MGCRWSTDPDRAAHWGRARVQLQRLRQAHRRAR
nr:hypothetical protein [Pseudomonas frederiksbergensis]